MHSLKDVATGSSTIRQGGSFWYNWHVKQPSVTSTIDSFILLSELQGCLAEFKVFINFSGVGCTNCLCNFNAISYVDLLSLFMSMTFHVFLVNIIQ